MELILSNVEPQHKQLFAEMAKILNFKIAEIEQNEDNGLLKAIETGKSLGRATPTQKAEFENWLFK
jgi:hypothetical protein